MNPQKRERSHDGQPDGIRRCSLFLYRGGVIVSPQGNEVRIPSDLDCTAGAHRIERSGGPRLSG